MVSRANEWRSALLALFLVFWVGASNASAQPGNEPANMPAKFLDLRGGKEKSQRMRLKEIGIVWEAEGARITLPSGQVIQGTSGLVANFTVQGDFEITMAYEIINAERPKEGYGVGATVYLSPAENGGNTNALSLSRRLSKSGETRFVANWLQRSEGKPPNTLQYLPSKSAIGKLRIQRVGPLVQFLVAEGDDPVFKPTGKSLPFGADDIRYIHFGGNAGDSAAALDMRLLDFSFRAERLLGLDEAPSDAAPPDAVQAGTARLWLISVGALGTCVLFLVAVGVGALVVFRKRRKAAVREEVTKPNQTPIPFVCSECGRALKVKPHLAGKKVKCPQCGSVATAPSTS